jgi:transcription factor TFIIIB component B''
MSFPIVMPGQRKPAAPPSILASTNDESTSTQGDQNSPAQLIEAPASAPSRGRKRKPPERSDGQRTSSTSTKRRRIQKSNNHQESSELVQNGEQSQTVQASENESSSGEDQPIRRRRKPRPRIDKAVLELPEEGDPIDETMMTMKDLCNGMVQGRVSGRYLETFMKSNADTRRKREDNAKLRELTRRKELGLPVDEDEVQPPSASNRKESRRGAQQVSEEETHVADQDADEEVEEEDEYRDVANITSRAPKVRYDANGVLVVDETELEYDRQAEADAELEARGPIEVVVETDRDKFTNFASYAKKPRPDRWSREETETFYLVSHEGYLRRITNDVLLPGTPNVSYRLRLDREVVA